MKKIEELGSPMFGKTKRILSWYEDIVDLEETLVINLDARDGEYIANCINPSKETPRWLIAKPRFRDLNRFYMNQASLLRVIKRAKELYLIDEDLSDDDAGEVSLEKAYRVSFGDLPEDHLPTERSYGNSKSQNDFVRM